MSATIGEGDALIVVDVQRDFLPGGALARMREAGATFAATAEALR